MQTKRRRRDQDNQVRGTQQLHHQQNPPRQAHQGNRMHKREQEIPRPIR